MSIEVKALHKWFGSQHVLRGLDLPIEPGVITVIIGGSGQGKTVLLKHLIGLEKPTSGQILVDGEDIVPLSERQLLPVRRKFGMVFQYAALFDSMNVYENISFPLREHAGMKERERRERVRSLLEAVNLPNIEHKFPSELSGGMRKRVGLARALVLNPEIVLYDEPTTGLDPIATENVDRMIQETAQKFKVTSVVISHDIPSTLRIADRIAMLFEGKIAAYGRPDEIRTNPHPMLQRFLALGLSDRSVAA
jgi:phospholipid/cholesterol/gamma-HCH transport system ATP-binding protein